jgi:hypothetical protein
MFTQLITDSLPKFNIPRHHTNTNVWFRPLLVKEEKKLLTAQELGTKKEIIKAVQEVLNSCFENLHAEKLPTYEFDYFFVQLRCKSISESVSAKFICPETDEKININLDLSVIKFDKLKKTPDQIKISNDLSIVMRPPSYNDLIDVQTDDVYDEVIKIAANCIQKIYTKSDVYEVNQDNKNDVLQMLLNMTPKQFSLIVEYLQSLPKYEYVYEYTTSDGEKRKIEFSGIEDFFTLALAT